MNTQKYPEKPQKTLALRGEAPYIAATLPPRQIEKN
jgi:hypothetical protein